MDARNEIAKGLLEFLVKWAGKPYIESGYAVCAKVKMPVIVTVQAGLRTCRADRDKL